MKNAEFHDIYIDDEKPVADYYLLKEEIENERENLRSRLFIPSKIEHFLSVGRVVKIRKNDLDFGFCIVVRKKSSKIYVLMNVSKESYEARDESLLRPPSKGCQEIMDIFCVSTANVYMVTTERLRIPKVLYNKQVEIVFVKEQLSVSFCTLSNIDV